jgi:DNA-directed RNA polymerase specialized sigma24 family protein
VRLSLRFLHIRQAQPKFNRKERLQREDKVMTSQFGRVRYYPTMSMSDSNHGRTESCRVFATTHWSVVTAAGRLDSPEASLALERLCATYWYPLYAFVRRRGLNAHDAEDTIQGFFQQLFERESFRDRTPERGRFRSFLLGALNYYMADLHAAANAAKRGGGQSMIALDALEAEERYQFEPVDRLTAEKIFERRWALTLMNHALARLEREWTEDGRAEIFRELRPHVLNEDAEAGYEEIGARLKLSAGALRVAAHRLRKRCRELFREEVAQTLEHPRETDEELRHLRRALLS